MDEARLQMEACEVVDEVRVTLAQEVETPMAGFDELVNDMVPVNPLNALTRRLLLPVDPLGKLTSLEFAVRLKSGGGLTVTSIGRKWCIPPL